MPVKSMLAKIANRKAIGLYIGEREIAISQVAATPFGLVEVASHHEPCAPDQLVAGLQRLLKPLVGNSKNRRTPVAIGLPATQVFFSTRPIHATNSDASAEILLHEVLQSQAISIEELVIDLIKTKPGRRAVASLAACRKKYMTGLLAALAAGGVRPFRAEPGPCALVRAAMQQHRPPLRAKTVLRIFLGDQQGVAVLGAGHTHILWRYFDLPRGDEASAILCWTRSMQILGKHSGIDSGIDAVMIHGRTDLQGLLQFEWLQQQIGIRVVWTEGPKLDNSAIAFGLAVGCLKQSKEAFDLARSLKPRLSLSELFPWGEVALQTALLVCMALFLTAQYRGIKDAHGAVRAEQTRYDWLESLQQPELEKEKKELTKKVDAIRNLLSTRIVWTSYTRDIPARLPINATLNSFHGMCELEAIGKKKEAAIKPKKSLVLRVGAPIQENGAIPEEIDSFLDSLREHPLLKNDFPLVTLADLKWYQPSIGSKPTAFITVVCLPKADKGTPKSSTAHAQKGSGEMVEE